MRAVGGGLLTPGLLPPAGTPDLHVLLRRPRRRARGRPARGLTRRHARPTGGRTRRRTAPTPAFRIVEPEVTPDADPRHSHHSSHHHRQPPSPPPLPLLVRTRRPAPRDHSRRVSRPKRTNRPSRVPPTGRAGRSGGIGRTGGTDTGGGISRTGPRRGWAGQCGRGRAGRIGCWCGDDCWWGRAGGGDAGRGARRRGPGGWGCRRWWGGVCGGMVRFGRGWVGRWWKGWEVVEDLDGFAVGGTGRLLGGHGEDGLQGFEGGGC